MKNKKFLKNTFFLYIMRFANYVFPMITIPYITRVVGKENYGVYSWSNAIMVYVRMVIDFGFVISAVGEIAMCGDDKQKIGKIINSVLVSKIILAASIFAFLIPLCLLNDKFHDNYLIIYISFLPPVISIFNIDYVYQGIEKMESIAYRTIGAKTIYTLLILLFIHKPNHYIFIPVFTAIGDLIATVFMWRQLIKNEYIVPKYGGLKEVWKRFKYSAWFFVSRCSSAVWNVGNTIILGFVCPDEKVAQYSLAYSLITTIYNLRVSQIMPFVMMM